MSCPVPDRVLDYLAHRRASDLTATSSMRTPTGALHVAVRSQRSRATATA